ncbi:hypothetical protein FGIG_11192 [Fasciola gigantica]|uniref:Uncharacterized protein n=1 Tax=Fasciola gigantica TaxID=46835 RepID=A0A504YNR2_FASGI|nr:hypothetical protein FGIG_11192 [Fasciola gigantica]
MAPNGSEDVLSSICGRLRLVHTRLTSKFPFFPCQLNDLSVPTAQPHLVAFRVSAVVLLITYGFRLGLHSVKPVQSHSDVTSALDQMISSTFRCYILEIFV